MKHKNNFLNKFHSYFSILFLAVTLMVSGDVWGDDCFFTKDAKVYLDKNGQWGDNQTNVIYYRQDGKVIDSSGNVKENGNFSGFQDGNISNVKSSVSQDGNYFYAQIPREDIYAIRFIWGEGTWCWGQSNLYKADDVSDNKNCVQLSGQKSSSSLVKKGDGANVVTCVAPLSGDFWVVSDNNNWVKCQSTYKMHSASTKVALKLVNIKGSKGLDFYILDAEGNALGLDKFSTAKSTNINSAAAGSKTGSIKLSFSSTARNITIYYDGTNIYAVADHINTHSTQLAFPGDFNGWNNSSNQLSMTDNYAHTTTFTISAASGHDSNRGKVVKSGSWDSQLGNEQIDELSSCYPKGNDWENYDNRIVIKCAEQMKVTPTVWKADGDTKWLTLVAIPAAKRTVTFNMMGHGTAIDAQQVDYDAVVSKPADPSATNYQFDGWFSDENCTIAYDFDKAVQSAFSLYAKWTSSAAVTYTVHFNTDGGSTIADKVVNENEKVARPTDPTKDGFVFVNWYSDQQKTQVFDFNTSITKETTLYAKWVEAVMVQFNTNYGSSVSSQSIAKGAKASKPSDPSKNNNTFKGWYQNPDFSGSTFDFANTVINENITLYAKWDYNGTIYYVNGSNLGIDGWNSSDWDPNMPKTPLMTDAGDHIEHVVPVAFKKGDDIRFKLVPCNQKWSDNNYCWNNALNWDPNFSTDRSTATLATYQEDGTNYKINLTGDDSYRVTICYDGVNVYAVINQIVDRTVKFYSNGDLKDTKVVKDGEKVTPPTVEAPSAGKVLEGWYENSELSGSKYNFDTPISGGDKNFYAKWIDGVSVTFISNYGSAVETQFLSIGSKATKPSNPTKDHCTFKDWYQNPDFSGSAFDFNKSINENKTLYAKWEYTGSTKHYLVGTFMGCDNWGACLDNAIEMTKNGDHLEAILENVYKKGADLRFKINRNAKDDWNNSLKWSDFSSDRSTGAIATYQGQGDNIQINITGDETYSVTMCYDGVSVYAVLAEVQVHKVTFMDGGRNVKEVDVVDGKKTSAPTIEHRGVDLDWYTEPELKNLFDFANAAITADKTLYSKPKAVSGNFYLTGAIWHNWTTENKTPQMTVSNGVATYSFVAPVGNNTIRTLKGSRNEGDYIDARF